MRTKYKLGVPALEGVVNRAGAAHSFPEISQKFTINVSTENILSFLSVMM